ncbi:MAG TPA: heme ABC transporter ATP-binding protein, partial [Synergistales bacterium]|nr:heme ABC transporter ATP-binding protein [Synergistales bacterium]
VPDGGDVLLGGEPLPPGRPKTAVDRKMARIPEDRMTTGLLLELTVEENLVLENHASFRSFGMLDHAAIGRHADRLIGEFGITTDGRRAVARTLSGGNLQKIILARELSASPRAVVAAQPTRGLDVGAIEYVHKRILEARESGAAILLISEDLDEIFLLADRIAVMYEGRIMGVAERDEASREQVGLWMSGVNEPCA